MICTDSHKEYMYVISKSKKGSNLSAELTTSISVITLSIIALSATLFLYCFLSNLRQSVPGKNNLSLVTALLCAQRLYLISSFSELEEYSTICFVLGLFVHFSWLVALFWMNICTYHMFRVLTKTRVITSSSGLKRLILYHAYAFLMAAVFVSMNIVLSYISNGDYGYGGKACYNTSQRMLILTFGIPATLIVLSNLIMFTVVVIKIKRSPSVQKNVKNERNDIVIFAKLSTITGATWIFGLLYMFTKSIVLSYIFIFLNASRGIFIMFSFVVNRRVFNSLREKVLGLDVVSSSSGQTTTRTM
ncbi:adhesion G protein-coupled receptor L4-like [Ruditapes philippinarum]|uniref:adhesion G protein-coupled receptor L4-like n=1 Tax=Ruditapes philippinarum TaxID=129788 RepID=UPI00295C3400|nr:adhesion G protein-coupled receptor L4-like [Ruditapes philippinarum]